MNLSVNCGREIRRRVSARAQARAHGNLRESAQVRRFSRPRTRLEQELQPQRALLGRREHVLAVHREARLGVCRSQAGAFLGCLHIDARVVLLRQLGQRQQVLRSGQESVAAPRGANHHARERAAQRGARG